MPQQSDSRRTNSSRSAQQTSSGRGNRQPGDAGRRVSAATRQRQLKKKKKNRIILTVFLVLLLIAVIVAVIALFFLKRNGTLEAFAQPFSTEREFVSESSSKEKLETDTFARNICVFESDVPNDQIQLPAGQEGLLLDVNEQKTLYAKDAFQKVYPASITKLVTAIMALEYGNMADTVTIRQEDLQLEEGAQVCGFIPGDQLTMDQLLHCLLVYSGNDAAMAIADHIGGSIEGFVEMMNSYAASLGCTGTHFVNPHGLHDPDHYTTPYDIYLILKEAANYPEFTSISQLPSYTVEYDRSDGTHMKTLLQATDHYLTGEATLPKDVTVLGGKTGTTSDAGNCLALLTQNAFGRPFVSIVMGAGTKDLLYDQMNTLLMQINN